MQFSTMQSEVADQTGLDLTDSATATRIKRWLNITQQDIYSRWPWEFTRDREIVQTVADITTGTVSVSSGSTTVTGSGTAFASTAVGKFIQFQGNLDWYKVTAVASTTSLTIEAAYAPTSALSAGTYILRKVFYSLSSSADRILDIRNQNTPLKLFQTDPRLLDTVVPNAQSASNTSSFITYGYDSSGNIQISPYPFPSDARNLEVRTFKRLSDLSSDSDTSVIPTKWHHVMIYGANSLAFAYKNQLETSEIWRNRYENKIDDMKKQSRTSEDESLVLAPMDARSQEYFLSMGGFYPVVR